MSSTEQRRGGRLARRVVPLLTGVAVGVVSAVLLSGDPASAAGHTVTVSFTADGPSPASVTIDPGDRVVFRNDVDPSSGTLLGVVTGAVRSVTVEVRDAAQTPFTLAPGQSQTLTYTQPVRATYTATYQPTMVLGLLPGRPVDATGTVLVQAPSGDSVPVVTPAPASTNGGMSPLTSGGQPAAPAQQPVGGRSEQQGPQVNYTPNRGDAAAGQVPRGSTGGVSDDPGQPAGAPAKESASGPGGPAELPRLGSAQSQPRHLDRASRDGALGSLGLPAILAVVLLSMVSAALVRTIMVRHTSLA